MNISERELRDYERETARLLTGYDEGDVCHECGADIGDQPIGLDKCPECMALTEEVE